MSVTTVPEPATDGPSLATSTVQVTRSPAMGSRAWCLSIVRSADVVTVAVSVSALLAVRGRRCGR